jgi:hypothetical protein
VLACFAVLAGVPAADAVSWVKKNYCQKAVETKEQQWFVLWFDAWLRDVPAPPRPLGWTSTSFTSTPAKKEGAEQKGDGLVVKSHTPLAQSIPCPLCGTACDNQGYICNWSSCSGFTITRGSPRAKDLFAQVAAKHEAAAKSVTKPAAAPHPAVAEISNPPQPSKQNTKRRGKRKGWKNGSGGR